MATTDNPTPWIEVIDEDDAEGSLARMFRGAQNEDGFGVDNILKIHGLHPESLRAHLLLYKTLMFGAGPLPRVQREMIAVTVSAANHCHY